MQFPSVAIFVFSLLNGDAIAVKLADGVNDMELGVADSSVSTALRSNTDITHKALDAIESLLGEPDFAVDALPTLNVSRALTNILDFLPVAVLVLAVAFYRRKTKQVVVPDLREDDGEKAETFESFRDTICHCFSDWNTCLWSFFCPCVRWAENQSAVGTVGFWAAVALILVLCGLDAVLGVAAWIAIALVQMLFRQLFRRAFKMEEAGTCCSFFKDFLAYCFCGPCTIAQEARHVEAAASAGHEAVTSV